ncbi:hypothetical protein Peur_043076 [Populus x canadensis]
MYSQHSRFDHVSLVSPFTLVMFHSPRGRKENHTVGQYPCFVFTHHYTFPKYPIRGSLGNRISRFKSCGDESEFEDGEECVPRIVQNLLRKKKNN